jgi:hypothetical protein
MELLVQIPQCVPQALNAPVDQYFDGALAAIYFIAALVSRKDDHSILAHCYLAAGLIHLLLCISHMG